MIRIWLISLLLCFSFMATVACKSGITSDKQETRVKKSSNTDKKKKKIKKNLLEFSVPGDKNDYVVGEKIKIELNKVNPEYEIDSIGITINNRRESILKEGEFDCVWNTENINPGSQKITAEAFHSGELKSRTSLTIILKSDIIPTHHKYEVVNIFPHDPQAYTQGLVYEDGFLYEGTGQRGKSSLRKILLQTGELSASLNLPPDLFGEGVCIFGDKIFQLTWTSKTGFVYDKKSFKYQNQIKYSTQGWGITTDGKILIMSDGTNYLYFLEPKYFSQLSKIEVFDDKGPVQNLNELEYINGIVYANIFMSDLIALIDPGNGKVLAYIDCKGLLKEEEKHPELDVLNGIAYDNQNNRLFITGKNWPKLFEIRIIED